MAIAHLTLGLLASAAADTSPVTIDVNQLGFAPQDAKIAIVQAKAGDPALAWRLEDAAGTALLEGVATPYGKDTASGAHNVQRIDFSRYRGTGEGLRIVVGGARSDPFAIKAGVYRPLARDALAFFYHQRVGVPIEARFVGERWARPAGHVNEIAKCFAGKDERGTIWPACNYSADVSGGWYDAGDHGKYVVNGGITLWTLLNAYENRPAAFPDAAQPIPESGNGVSDLLDEARVGIEWMLRMQVDEGVRLQLPVGPPKPVAAGESPWMAAPADFATVDAGGMAHQKTASRHWSAIPTRPADDKQERLLYPPTTAATLNFAAVTAQCARIWRGIDDAFSEKCLDAATRAWGAAKRNPQIYATNSFSGSGGYGDGDVSDEFYWAAAELLLTTGAAEYADFVRGSPHFDAPVKEAAWPQTASLATQALATRKSALSEAEVQKLRAQIIAAADGFLADTKGNGYAVPYRASDYPWGSNSSILNRAMLLATAHELTGEARFRNGVVGAMDYVLGRNPMRTSYVSAYGARSMQHPHHRFWAPSVDPTLPGPPPGVVSGGPNSNNMSDDVATLMVGKCAPQTCWADDIKAYALNEIAINWNAPLFWTAAWLARD